MELSEQESIERMAGEVFGRLAIATPQGPRIVPLNYAVFEDAIVFRTSPYSEVARYAVGKDAAFEVDEIDRAEETGWSVVAVGRVEELDPAELWDLPDGAAPQPWAGGSRNLYLRLAWRELTGRRLHGGLATQGLSRR
jgi:hypothetical protein